MPSRAGQQSGCHRCERLKALAQWKKHSFTSTPMATSGRLPCALVRSNSAASRTTKARPLTRSVSSTPGTMKSRPTPLVCRMFSSVSRRRLPGRSGMTSVVSSSTATKPGASPRGDTSPSWSAPVVPISRNGERAMKSRACRSRWSSCLRITRSLGAPMMARRFSALVMTSEKGVGGMGRVCCLESTNSGMPAGCRRAWFHAAKRITRLGKAAWVAPRYATG